MKTPYIILTCVIAGIFFMFGVVSQHDEQAEIKRLTEQIDSLEVERGKLQVIKDSLNKIISLKDIELTDRLERQKKRLTQSHEKISTVRTLSPDSAIGYFSEWVSDTTAN